MQVPQSTGGLMCCMTESLEFRYKQGIELLHIIGGGSQNGLLNQLTANAIDIPISTSPVKATAMGNALMQAKAMGTATATRDLKQIVINSAQPK